MTVTQVGNHRARYAMASIRQQRARSLEEVRRKHSSGVGPNPRRITMALDINSLYGPEVDLACGVEEPRVDQWESGEAVPTFDQLEALAELTGLAVDWFYLGDPDPMVGFLCGRSGCELVDTRPEAEVVEMFPRTLF